MELATDPATISAAIVKGRRAQKLTNTMVATGIN
jgi:hypothetical protein